MSKIKILLSAALLMLLTDVALAQRETINLNLRNQVYTGNSTLTLKQLLNRQHPRISINNLELISVRLFAKSRNGDGEAELRVGQRTSGRKRVMGRPATFNNNRPDSYDRIDFVNPARGDRGVWQIRLHGNIKVDRVVLVVETERRGRDRTHYIRCESEREGFRQTFCSAPGQIVSARLSQVHTRPFGVCIQGFNWGFEGRRIWVRPGCSATFEVVVR